ncbi:(2Fe-2S) ferredoxin domain-containing protein [Anabaena catenula]|uniref:(2Fe-2S) ferredoxin domain-containing protein n=1 Tax=Anabaena catenula FACHB-362 TaxID=2692877 RepID=A0ABR8J8Z8_9NOST|nr:(2Fe-2S) ferredoxin domain-containing protein [Anabaena catenula]MBD2694070.1 (2Fe-2S) ferredoxin domain-containing protein [Anabaena catenula FACHB-362]
MHIYTQTEVTEFCMEGRFLDFVIKDGYKLKGLLLSTSEGECYVKLAKHLRSTFDLRLPKGTWLQVVGTKQHDFKKDKLTLKAERVMAAREEMSKQPALQNQNQPKPAKTQTILVCQKSDCMKRGGKALCQALESELRNNGLEDNVIIKGTGCMKNCKAGPNLLMPDKTRYSKIQAAQVPALIDKHFGSEIQEQSKNVAVPQFAKV